MSREFEFRGHGCDDRVGHVHAILACAVVWRSSSILIRSGIPASMGYPWAQSDVAS